MIGLTAAGFSVLLVCFVCSVNAAASWQDAPVTNRVLCHTDEGDIQMEVHRDWAPLGADHFMELVEMGFYTDIAMYRSVPNFLTQFGISDRPEFQKLHGAQIMDDPNLHVPIRPGYVSYAGGGPNTRSTQIFIAYGDLSNSLGRDPWEVPFARVVGSVSMATLDKIYKGYGDIAPFGRGPDQQQIFRQGNKYVRDNFPSVTFIKTCRKITDTIDLTEADFQRELTEAPQASKPLKLKVGLDERPPRPTFGITQVSVAVIILIALAVAVINRPRVKEH